VPVHGSRVVEQPSRPVHNRDRHLTTVAHDTPGAATTSVFDASPAHASTIRDRNASACGVFRRRAHARRGPE
jgi:hypothetical protein